MTRVPTLSDEEFFSEYYLKKPVIFTSVARDWPAAKQWSPQFFAENFGDSEVFVQVAEAEHDSAYGSIDVTFEKVTFSDYVSRLGAPDAGYLCVYPLLRQFPCLTEHVDFPKYEEPGVEISVTNDFFFAGAGALTPLHYDLLENLFFQAYGIKRFLLIDPKFTDCCYPVNRTWIDGYSEVAIEKPDFGRHPKFRDVPIVEVDIAAGELMYVPGGWWHAVQSLETNISINKWWGPPEFVEKNREHLLDPNGMAPYVYDITPDMIVKEMN